MSPGLSAFWATVAIIGILATRGPLLALFRRQDLPRAARRSLAELVDGLGLGARNMIGIGIATATAGIIVGTITLTGLGLMMTELVEAVSGGNVMIMLALIAVISLVLGMGIPTTANYILVATLMAPVVVELGAQAGLRHPADRGPSVRVLFRHHGRHHLPVGLAAFAAAAISREDPIKTGFQGALYSLRTAVLPFVFVFNPGMLLIGVEGWADLAAIVTVTFAAVLLFSAATMGYFVTRSRLWESALLLVACFALFRPDWWLDRVYALHRHPAPATFLAEVAAAPAGHRLTFVVEGLSIEGEEVRKTVSLPLGEPQPDPAKRLRAAGLGVSADGVTITDVGFGSYARRTGLEAGYDITAVLKPADRPGHFWVYLPALALVGLVALLQWSRTGGLASRNRRPGQEGLAAKTSEQ